ncbi:hypothetical protein COO91_09481 (plasmid) [Nostoc flagelliforme CCNUN1]|uniref:Uncharacterized protein n=1 Tax=Nostoc flagelliforme CCNUN1 TaxID=2038116 RepID=A0A2K8T6H1_9NOSO|nr:hypothetical protein COO91_09481 [Nostoc flagelliforme CCNUN1]
MPQGVSESAFQGTGIVGRLRVESCSRDRQPQNFGPNPDYFVNLQKFSIY